MKHVKARALAAAVVVAVLAVGCSNSSDKSEGDTTTPTGGSNTPTTYQGTDFSINQPVDAQGVTDSEIKIASVTAKTSVLGGQEGDLNIGLEAYVDKVNDEGGIWGRKINFASQRDDLVGTRRAHPT